MKKLRAHIGWATQTTMEAIGFDRLFTELSKFEIVMDSRQRGLFIEALVSSLIDLCFGWFLVLFY